MSKLICDKCDTLIEKDAEGYEGTTVTIEEYDVTYLLCGHCTDELGHKLGMARVRIGRALHKAIELKRSN